MSRQKLFNQIKARGLKDVGRNLFDLTNKHIYTSKIARITPVKCISTYPKDYFNIDVSEFSQNITPLNTAAFVDGIKELSAYFVPNNTIWHNFNQFIATREDPDSVLLQEKGISYLPRISRYTLITAAAALWEGWQRAQEFAYFEAFSTLFTQANLINVPGTENKVWTSAVAALGESFTLQELLNKIYSYNTSIVPELFEEWFQSGLNDFKNEQWSQIPADSASYRYLPQIEDFYVWDYGSDVLESRNLEVYCDIFGHFKWCDWLRKLDMLGYGNAYPHFKRATEAVLYEFENMYSYVLTTDDCSTQPKFCAASASKAGGYIRTNVFPILSTYINNTCYSDEAREHLVYVDVWPLYAYNKIFYDMFRNTYYDLQYNVRNYNVDFLDCSSLEGSIVTFQNIPARFYDIECHQWKKDMFTGVLPDNQLGDVSSVTLSIPALSVSGDTALPTYGTSSSDVTRPYVNGHANGVLFKNGSNLTIEDPGSDIGVVQLQTRHIHGFIGTANTDQQVSFNVLAQKRAEAIQQYRQDLLRAGNRTRDIFNQIFGASPKSELDESPYFIEACNQPLNVNPIIATAQTDASDNGKLGDIAARLTIGGNSLSFKFSTEDYGSLIILHYIIPDSFYNSYRIDPCRTLLTQEDLGLPYFQNLGLKPVIGEYLNNNISYQYRNRVLGYAPPYIERKTDIDLCHGPVCDTEFNGKKFAWGAGSLSHWCVARTDLQMMKAVSLPQFYINPSIMDNVFEMSVGDDYETDQLLNYCVIKVDAVRAFSELGLPRFV